MAERDQLVHELTMLYLQKQTLNASSPEEIAKAYYEALDKIKKACAEHSSKKNAGFLDD